MAIYHRDEYASPAYWALDVMGSLSYEEQRQVVISFLNQYHGNPQAVVGMFLLLEQDNAEGALDKFSQFLIKEADSYE